MLSLEDLEKLVLEENPKPLYKNVNDVMIELSDSEYEESIKTRALMLFQQQEQDVKAEQKAAILERLGLTEDELRVVLS